MKQFLYITMALCAALIGVAQGVLAVEQSNDDPVVMTINGKQIAKSEFEYSYKKNNGPEVIDHKTVREYVELFINYKVKVEAALDAHLDTLSSYNKEFRQYRDQQVMPTIINEEDIEEFARKTYDETKQNIGPDGMIMPQHILFMTGQNPSDSLMNVKKEKADSVYNALLAGADFDEMAKKLSDDKGSARNGGAFGWVSRGQTLKAFEDAAFALQKGEMCKPILSEVGYHIIKMKDRKQLEPYEELKNEIYAFIEKRNLRKAIAKNRLKSIAEAQGTTEENVMDSRADSISAIDQDMKYLIGEYHDGLLLFEIANREVWEKAANDEDGLKAFFKKNKKKYAWDEPRFKGIAYHTKDVADVEAVKKAVKGKKFDEWAQILRTTFNSDSTLRIRVEKGVFKKGDNALIDKTQFGVADAKVHIFSNFPNDAVYGKMIKAPEEMGDVRNLVVADYQDAMEQEWLKVLRAKYPAVVYWDVVDTIKE